jgi:Tfp pilus assembly protein PilO
MRYITPIILTGIAIAFFFMYTNPMYDSISDLNTQIAAYNTALSTSKELEGERDTLTNQYNNIDPDNFAKIQKLLPDNINNIRLILEIGQIAAPYGMTLSNVSYDSGDDSTTDTSTTPDSTAPKAPVVQAGDSVVQQNSDYGTFNLSFSTSGTYDNFLNFTKDLESNLRIVDISSVSFSSDANAQAGTSAGTKTNSPEVYTYNFKVKTYWLKS